MAYVFIESPALLIILKTCNSTEIPPNPNKNDVIIIFIERTLITLPVIVLIANFIY